MSMREHVLMVSIHCLFCSILSVRSEVFRRTDLSKSSLGGAKPDCRWYSAYNGSDTTEMKCARPCAFESGCYYYQYSVFSEKCAWCLNSRTTTNRNLTKTDDYISHSALSHADPFYQKMVEQCGPRGMCIQKSCGEYREEGYHTSGVYLISSPIGELEVYCDMNTRGGGWMVFLRRVDGTVDFYRDWNAYKEGFGNISHEFWMGNEIIAALTTEGSWEMHVDLEDFEGTFVYATYSNFILDADDNYALRYQSASGNVVNSLGLHKNQAFTTQDRDNDLHYSNCAVHYKGAWWFNACHTSGLTGEYLAGKHNTFFAGVLWMDFRGMDYSLKFAEMKMRPMDFNEPKSLYPLETDLPVARDCSDLRDQGHTQSGVYTIHIQHLGTSLEVYCDMVTQGGGWLVIERRQDGSVNFNRNWTEYENGFGSLEYEFWFGNKNIASITEQASYRLKINLQDFEGNNGATDYASFAIDRNDDYKLWIDFYTGSKGDSLTTQKGYKWSTFDRVNDLHSCAEQTKGAWWFSGCNTNTLNGVYGENPSNYMTAMNWPSWKGFQNSLRAFEMKIRPAAYIPPS